MKTAYELAMERLNKNAPSVKLNPEQKAAMAELDSKYAARIAEREIALETEMRKAAEQGDALGLEQLQQQLSQERHKLSTELEEKKEAVRKGG